MSTFLGECDCGCGGECKYARVTAYRPVRGHVPIDPTLRVNSPGLVYGNGTLNPDTRWLITRIFDLTLSGVPAHFGSEGIDPRQTTRYRHSRWTCSGSGSGHTGDSTWASTIDFEIIRDVDEHTNIPLYTLDRRQGTYTSTNPDLSFTSDYRREYKLNTFGVVEINSTTGAEMPTGTATLDTVAFVQSGIDGGWVTGHSKATYTASETLATLNIDIDIAWPDGHETWNVTYQLTLTHGLTIDDARTQANTLIDENIDLRQLGTLDVIWTSLKNAEGYWGDGDTSPLDWWYHAEVFWNGPFPGYPKQLVIRRSGFPDVSGKFITDPTIQLALTYDTGVGTIMFPEGGAGLQMMGLMVQSSRARLDDGGKSVVGLRNCAWVYPHWDPDPTGILDDPNTPTTEDNGTPAPPTDFTTRTGTRSCINDVALGDFILRWDEQDPPPETPPAIPEIAVGSTDWGDAWLLWACGHQPPVKEPVTGFDYTICCGWGDRPDFNADTLDIDADSVDRDANEISLT